ncbi:MAG: DUF2934 domain-containing protein [Deferrisomatales bacterium]
MTAAKRRIGPEEAEAPARRKRATRARKSVGSRGGTEVRPAPAPAGTQPADLEALIRQAAYVRAESRGFVGGSPEQDWLEAEAEVDHLRAQERSRT